MSQTWQPVIQNDLDGHLRKLLEFRDIFYSSIGPKNNYKIFVPSADGAPNKCTSTSKRIVSSLKGVYGLLLWCYRMPNNQINACILMSVWCLIDSFQIVWMEIAS